MIFLLKTNAVNIEELRAYCLSRPEVTEHFPFDEVTLVFKVAGKMFALIPTDELELSIALKCDPARAQELREHFPSITGAYHMNKTHWNTVRMGPGITDELLKELIDHSCALIVASLPRKTKEKLSGKKEGS